MEFWQTLSAIHDDTEVIIAEADALVASGGGSDSVLLGEGEGPSAVEVRERLSGLLATQELRVDRLRQDFREQRAATILLYQQLETPGEIALSYEELRRRQATRDRAVEQYADLAVLAGTPGAGSTFDEIVDVARELRTTKTDARNEARAAVVAAQQHLDTLRTQGANALQVWIAEDDLRYKSASYRELAQAVNDLNYLLSNPDGGN